MRILGFCLALVGLSASPLLTYDAMADDTGLAGMHDWRKERGKTCLLDHYHTGQGEGRTKRAARRAAIVDWESFTAFEYGSNWARFRSAGSRGIRYDKVDAGWKASVEARPCRRRIRSARK